MSQLRATLSAEGASAQDFAQLQTLIDAKTTELARTVELYQSGDPTGALGLVMTNRGLNVLDGIRAEVARLQERQSAGLAADEREQARAVRITDAVLLLDTFGRKKNLELFSIMCLVSTLAAAGPWIGGAMKDHTGGFEGAFWLFAAVVVAALVAVALMRPVQARAIAESSRP